MLEEKIINEDIKIFRYGNIYRIYGKTFDVREELKQLGAKWNNDNKKLEMSEEDFSKLSDTIKNKVMELEKKQKKLSLENIKSIILTGQIRVYLNEDNMYRVYGRTKEIYKDLQNIGFELLDNNYAMRKEDFDRIFSNEVKEFINDYETNKTNEKAEIENEESEEEIYEQEIY